MQLSGFYSTDYVPVRGLITKLNHDTGKERMETKRVGLHLLSQHSRS